MAPTHDNVSHSTEYSASGQRAAFGPAGAVGGMRAGRAAAHRHSVSRAGRACHHKGIMAWPGARVYPAGRGRARYGATPATPSRSGRTVPNRWPATPATVPSATISSPLDSQPRRVQRLLTTPIRNRVMPVSRIER
jgi:hypothetical protein